MAASIQFSSTQFSKSISKSQSNFNSVPQINTTFGFSSSVMKQHFAPLRSRSLQIVNSHVEKSSASALSSSLTSTIATPPEVVVEPPIKIGIIGFGNFGQFLAKAFQRQGHTILATSRSDYSDYCLNNGIEFFRDVDGLCEAQPDLVLVCSSIVSTENVVRGIPFHKLKPDTIFADVLSVKQFPRNLLLEVLPEEFGVLCTHPMFGPNSGGNSWEGLRFVYDKVRISENTMQGRICSQFLSIFENEGCRMVEMLCEEHDRYAAGSQFITHTIGRILSHLDLDSTPINTKGYETLLELTENTVSDSFDLYYGLFMYNVNATEQIENIDRAFETVKQKLFGRLHDILRKQIVERGSMENARNHQPISSSSSPSTYFLPASTSNNERMKDLSSFAISSSQQTNEVPVAIHH